eukprot:364509-Chlamydomonas_euryale.AAC.6
MSLARWAGGAGSLCPACLCHAQARREGERESGRGEEGKAGTWPVSDGGGRKLHPRRVAALGVIEARRKPGMK